MHTQIKTKDGVIAHVNIQGGLNLIMSCGDAGKLVALLEKAELFKDYGNRKVCGRMPEFCVTSIRADSVDYAFDDGSVA